MVTGQVQTDEGRVYESHELEKFCMLTLTYLDDKFELFAIPPEIAISTDMAWMMDLTWLRVKQEIMGEDMDGLLVMKTPLNWWEHVKKRWMPNGWRKRWPIKYRESVHKARVMYPWIPKDAGVVWIKVADTADEPKLYWNDEEEGYTED